MISWVITLNNLLQETDSFCTDCLSIILRKRLSARFNAVLLRKRKFCSPSSSASIM